MFTEIDDAAEVEFAPRAARTHVAAQQSMTFTEEVDGTHWAEFDSPAWRAELDTLGEATHPVEVVRLDMRTHYQR